MPANLDIIITATDEASAEIDNVGESLGGLEKGSEQAGLSLTDLKSGLDLAVGGFKLVKGAVQSVIDPVVAYSKNIRDLSAFTGTTTEESSKLINITDDLGIEYNTLRTAARKLVDDGLQPNVDTLAELSDEYLNIQDPVARSQFLMETFGSKAGPEMARLLEQGSEAIRNMAQDAEDAGLVMDEQAVAAARNYEMALDDLEDSALALKITLSEKLIPAITDSLNEMTAVTDSNKAWSDALAEGIVTQDEAAAALLRVRTGASSTAEELAVLKAKVDEYHQGLVEVDPAVQNMRLAQEAAAVSIDVSSVAIQSQTQWLADLASVTVDQTTPATYDLLTASDLLAAGMAGLTEKMIFNQAAAGLDSDAALNLAVSMGLVDTRVLALNEALPTLKDKYDTNADGAISASEAAAGYTAAVQALTDALMSIPANVTSTVTTNFVQNGNQYGGPAGPPATPQYEATGGNYNAGPLVTGEQGPELQFPNTPGYVMNNNMSNRLVSALEALANSGGQRVNNYYGVGADMAAGQAQSQAGAF